ncbi:hypothetical protein [Rhizobium sp.]|uniref:hypothetical protein n=1 Tax=Rhizobium sp. TaxID=391 RepID=UPI000E94B3AC|nr:hypothetical protein [Rhizobium sp.]
MALRHKSAANDSDPVYEVYSGETITSWVVSPLLADYFPGVAAVAEDRANYRFINGFVAVGDLPCRKAFWATMVGREIAPDVSWQPSHLNLPGSNRRVEFTNFWHIPTHVRRWLRGGFRANADRALNLRIRTCGGVRIFVNGVEQVRFEPFRRNVESVADVSLRLVAGENDILVHTEDLAERDTFWFVELEVTDAQPITVVLPVALDGEEVAKLEALVRGVRPSRDVFVGEPLELLFDVAPVDDLAVVVEVFSHGHDRAILVSTTAVLKAGETRLLVPEAKDLPDGYHGVRLRMGSGAGKVSRAIDAAFLSDVAPQPGPSTLAERKQQALAYQARHGAPRIGRVLAMAASGKMDEAVARTLVDDALDSIDWRKDCSDFIMVPLLWLLTDYAEMLPVDLQERVRQSVLNYRYWVDEPGNDTMWFWSENHVLCFHTSQLLAGQLLPDAVFSASGRTGREQVALATERLGKWFDSVEAHGLAEWNSAAYYPIDFIGLLALEKWAEPEIASRARHQLDLIFRMIALHTLAGVPAGSQGRAYDKELRAGPLTELAPFAWVAFGNGWLNGGVASLPMFCASDYAPPPDVLALAQLEPGRSIEARYAQGLESGKLVLFKTEASQLSTVVDHKTGTRGHQQHVLDVRLGGHPMARLWVNNPGEDDPWGHQRPSYWAGNGILPRVAQHRDIALMIFDSNQSRLPLTHAYIGRDGLDEFVLEPHWLFARSGRGFTALYNSHELELVEAGAMAGREVRSHAPISGWVVTVGSGDEAAFQRFIDNAHETVIHFDVQNLTLRVTPPNGTVLQLTYDGTFLINQHNQPFAHEQPVPVLTYDSRAANEDAVGPFYQ